MKKVISIICITLLVALYSCDERDDLRSDIDNLKERVANLEASIEQMNSDISNYQQMVEGKILVVGYSKDEQDNYTIELSNGETITIYSGKVDMNDMPLFSVNASGHWAYTINDMTTELLVNDKPVSAIPEAGTAGVTPKLKVDANGFWLVSIDIRRTDLHQDILERRLLPGSETSGKTADHEDRCQLGNSLATLQDRRKQCAARLFVCRI